LLLHSQADLIHPGELEPVVFAILTVFSAMTKKIFDRNAVFLYCSTKPVCIEGSAYRISNKSLEMKIPINNSKNEHIYGVVLLPVQRTTFYIKLERHLIPIALGGSTKLVCGMWKRDVCCY